VKNPVADVELSPGTRRRLERLFAPNERATAALLLIRECGANLPLLEDRDAVGLERFRYAALKVSRGRLPELREAIRLAQVDWRDLLVAAGFAHDPLAHERWEPEERTDG
jgi:hypothetical protein